LHLLEPPMEQQYDFMWLRDVISRVKATGFIVMVDSARPQSFAEFISILYTIRGFHNNIPLVVGANRKDHPRAWSMTDLQLGLGISDAIVQGCNANDYQSVRDVLITLLNRMPMGQQR
jgi:signal recognition particle receptor subunit beta